MTDPPDSEDGWAVVHIPLDSEPPGPITTEEDEPEPDSPDQIPVGAPGERIFSLEGRPAAGLYLVGWLFSLLGAGLLLMTILTAETGVPQILVLVSIAFMALGLTAAAGYQIVARTATRAPDAYRGPSPPIVFGVALVAVGVASIALGGLGFDPVANTTGFLANLIAVELCYALVVWLLVVRAGALRWRDMRWPVGRSIRDIVLDVGYGSTLMVPTLIGIGIVASFAGRLLDVTAPDILPPANTGYDLVLNAIATIVVAPIGEELFFRGFALTAWLRDLGVRSALMRSALFFALIHVVNVNVGPGEFDTGVKQVILTLVEIIPLGLVLGWLFLRRGIVATIAGHATYNAVILLAAISFTGIQSG